MAGAEAVAVEADDDGFGVVLADGRAVRALRLILATGVVDVLPSIDRFGEFYGSSAFTCPTCDGYEAQDKTIVVIGEHDDLGGVRRGNAGLGICRHAHRRTDVDRCIQCRTRQGERRGHRCRDRHTHGAAGRRRQPRGRELTAGPSFAATCCSSLPTKSSTATWPSASAARFLTKDALSSMRTAEPRYRMSSPPETSLRALCSPRSPPPRASARASPRPSHSRRVRRSWLAAPRTGSEQCAQRMSTSTHSFPAPRRDRVPSSQRQPPGAARPGGSARSRAGRLRGRDHPAPGTPVASHAHRNWRSSGRHGRRPRDQHPRRRHVPRRDLGTRRLRNSPRATTVEARHAAPNWSASLGLVLIGWGLFSLVEGVINHHLLTIHHVRDDVHRSDVVGPRLPPERSGAVQRGPADLPKTAAQPGPA